MSLNGRHNYAKAQQSLTDRYSPVGDLYDEMMDEAGGVRPQWRPFLSTLSELSEAEIRQLWETAERLVRENGTTYNVYDEGEQSARPWRMDPIPFLIGADEWQQLERGLIQRARLLNAIVDDIYGSQSLLTGNLLPAPLIYGNPNFLRPLHGIRPAGGIHLHFMAFDLARAPDQRWWVLGDRTQAPSGAGYALENRIVLGRTLPDIFRETKVHRLAGFFQAMSDNFVRLTGKEEPLIVLLTPGPHNETYFEHAYLARYLGFPLVEGADLTVRDNKVYLKTLNGLKQVNLIFRRLDGEFCDPLELRNDSLLGIAGLVAAVRAGNVIVANSLGSGVVECDALMSFYPGLCQALLNEELLVPSLATWWCGQERERDYVVQNLDNLIVRRTFANTSMLAARNDAAPVGESLDARRDELARHIERHGWQFYGQESLTLSTTPIWRDNAMEPRPMVLRVYVCADGDGFRVMPGGLTRTASSLNAQAITMQQGDASKDTWVLSNTPVSTFTRLASPDQPIALRRSDANLPSRLADNLFWLGRYAERCESLVRLLRSMILRLAGEAGAGDDPQVLTRLTETLVDLGYLQSQAAKEAAAAGFAGVEREVAALLFDAASPSALPALLGNLQRTAGLVRQRLSIDSWRILNRLSARIAAGRPTASRLDMDGALALLNDILEYLQAFAGLQMENMTRSLGWLLLDAGRRVERIAFMTRLLRDMTDDGDPAGDGRLELLLELGDSSMTYRTRYLSTVQLHAVLDLLLADDTNPRSVAFQVARLAEHIRALPHDLESAMVSRDQYLITAIESEIKLADLIQLCRLPGGEKTRDELSALLIKLEQQSFELSDELARRYFSHIQPTRSTSSRGFAP